MDLFEYQARDLFEAHGVPVLSARLARTPEQAERAAHELGGTVVVKAQVKTGGRGKAGGVKVAKTPAEALEAADRILGMDIKGHIVGSVMIAQGADIAEEYYFSILLDRAERQYLVLASAQGGMDIEQLAVERPEALARVPISPLTGVDSVTAAEIAAAAGFPAAVRDDVAGIIEALWDVFQGEDATLVEVNPLARLADGSVVALDGKVTLDDNSAFRHPGHAKLVDIASTDPLEAKAKAKGLNYVKLDGQVGVIGNGAGLVMSTLDVVAGAGEDLTDAAGRPIGPANFLDIGGGASAEVMADSLDVVLSDRQVEAVLVNVFGGITACDEVARGIVAALQAVGDAANKPIVVRLDGNNYEEGRTILKAAAHPMVTMAETMDSAAEAVCRLVAEKEG